MNARNLHEASMLIVEDNLADVVLIKQFFAHEKISNHVSYATSLHQARYTLSKYPIDICFVDVDLPDGSGFDLVSELDTSATTVVMLSGSENIEHVLHAKGLGVMVYIRKPLTKPTLDRLVKELKHLHWSIVVDRD